MDNLYAIWLIISVLLAIVVNIEIIIILIIIGIYLYLYGYYKFEKIIQRRMINSVAMSLVIIYSLIKAYF